MAETVRTSASTPFWAHMAPFAAFGLVSYLGDHGWVAWGIGAAVAVVLGWRWQPWRGDPATWAHVAPFALWITLMMSVAEASAANYTTRTVLCAALWISARPWRWYNRPRWDRWPWAVVVGVAMWVGWVGLESDWARSAWPALSEWYERYAVGPFPSGWGKLRPSMESYPYLPERTGWIHWGIHMLGTSVVIATIEEFFWRGFLYRWLCASRFTDVPLTHRDVPMMWTVAVLFGLEHTEWVAGIVTGWAYAQLLQKTGNIWMPVVAHAITNFLLGIYVLRTDSWWFW